jgi:hypothetical protein
MADLDDALNTLRDRDRAYFATHGPMAAEALEALGYGHLAPGWAAAYVARESLEPIPIGAPLADDETAKALGDASLRGRWIATFDQLLERSRWQDVTREWLPRLIPAASADAAHGLIRAAHATRSLGERETPERLHELAEALGYWASAYEELPGGPGRGTPALASQAIAQIPSVPVDDQVWAGSITDRLRDLPKLDGFEDAVVALAPADDLAAFASDLAVVSAHLYLANAARARVIDFIHALDGVYAVRELIPFLDEDAARDLAFYGWQVVAALHASAGDALPPVAFEAPPADRVPALVERAVAIEGAHAIKFAQACVAEYALNPDPVFHACLEDMVVRMEELKEKLGLMI